MSREAFSPHSKDGEAPAPASSVPSRALKFGMDRILSEDLGRAPAAARRPTHAVQLARTEERGVGAGSDSCQPCVSSLLRCCRLGGDAAHYLHPFYPGLPPLHNPRPVRPYTNLILESEASERSPLAASNSAAKRKRSWSRAVFSNLQRKGLEKRFQIQKYITKPDRRQLAATLGLTDAQVKVWFQNRRMKWRHSKELKFHTGGFDPSDPRLEPPSPYPSAGPHALTPSSSSPLWSPTPPTHPPT